MQVQPYLFFEGRCEEAIEFYRRALVTSYDWRTTMWVIGTWCGW